MTDKDWLKEKLKKYKEADFFICTDFIFKEDKNGKSNLS